MVIALGGISLSTQNESSPPTSKMRADGPGDNILRNNSIRRRLKAGEITA
jgi:hypothetical protein